MKSWRHRVREQRGFTLIEALTSVALMGVILGALATITAQWLPSWNRGFARVQRNELVDVTLDRLVADLGAAEFVTAGRATKEPLFEGRELSVTFVRSALGPNTKPGLQVVRISETADRQGPVLVRAQAPFAPSDTASSRMFNFTNPVALLRAPYRVTFAYANREGLWQNTWVDQISLPSAVRLVVRDEGSERILAVTTAADVHVNLPAICVHPQNPQDCTPLGITGASDAGQPPSATAPKPGQSGG